MQATGDDFHVRVKNALEQCVKFVIPEMQAEGFNPSRVNGRVTIHSPEYCLDDLRDDGCNKIKSAFNEMKNRIRTVDRQGSLSVVFPTSRSFQFEFTSD